MLVWRQDGFNGEIDLSAEGLPKGVTCPPQKIGPGVTRAAMVLTAGADTAPWTGTFTVKGKAVIDGKPFEVEGRAGDVTWSIGQQQQNQPTVSRMSRNLVLAVRDGAPFQLTAKLEQDGEDDGRRQGDGQPGR